MLVLTRHEGERIMVGDDVELVVRAIMGDRVRLGFVAPITVKIHRAEIAERIRNEAALELARTLRDPWRSTP